MTANKQIDAEMKAIAKLIADMKKQMDLAASRLQWKNKRLPKR